MEQCLFAELQMASRTLYTSIQLNKQEQTYYLKNKNPNSKSHRQYEIKFLHCYQVEPSQVTIRITATNIFVQACPKTKKCTYTEEKNVLGQYLIRFILK